MWDFVFAAPMNYCQSRISSSFFCLSRFLFISIHYSNNRSFRLKQQQILQLLHPVGGDSNAALSRFLESADPKVRGIKFILGPTKELGIKLFSCIKYCILIPFYPGMPHVRDLPIRSFCGRKIRGVFCLKKYQEFRGFERLHFPLLLAFNFQPVAGTTSKAPSSLPCVTLRHPDNSPGVIIVPQGTSMMIPVVTMMILQIARNPRKRKVSRHRSPNESWQTSRHLDCNPRSLAIHQGISMRILFMMIQIVRNP